MKPTLSIIVLSFNTKETTHRCLLAAIKALKNQKVPAEIIVIDNASGDGSVEKIRNLKSGFKNLILLENKENVGYSQGNNQGIKITKGEYVLFLNSDAILEDVNFKNLIEYMKQNETVGALTVKVVLPNGKIDPASHRGFPTIWNSLTYFSKLEKIFGKTPFLGKIFGGYHLSYLNTEKIHEIDSGTGAFYLLKKSVLDKVGMFDAKNFFMYGEDLDLSYRVKQAGYSVIYYPLYKVLHLKYQSGLKKSDMAIQEKTKGYFYSAMKEFYKKHYAKMHSNITNNLVYFFIDIKKKLS